MGDYDEFGNFVLKFPKNGVYNALNSLNSRVVRYSNGKINQRETDKWIKEGMRDLPKSPLRGYKFDCKTHKVKVSNEKDGSYSSEANEDRRAHNIYTLRKAMRAGVLESKAKREN